MNRISQTAFYGMNRNPIENFLTHSANDVKNCVQNLARKGYPYSVEPEHILITLYTRQPEMIKDFLGDIKLTDLSNKLLGYEVSADKVEALFNYQNLPRFPVKFGHDAELVFNTALAIARLMGRRQAGCAELFVSLVMMSSGKDTRVKDLILESGINKRKVQEMYLECNLDRDHELKTKETKTTRSWDIVLLN